MDKDKTRPLKEYQNHLGNVGKLLEQFSAYEQGHQALRADVQAKIPAIKAKQEEGKMPLVLIQAEPIFLNSEREEYLHYIPELLTLDATSFKDHVSKRFYARPFQVKDEPQRSINAKLIQRTNAWKKQIPQAFTESDNPYNTRLPDDPLTKNKQLDPHSQALLSIFEENEIPYAFVPQYLKYSLKDVLTESEASQAPFMTMPSNGYKGTDKAKIPMVESKHPSKIGLNLFEQGLTNGTHPMYQGVSYVPELATKEGGIGSRSGNMNDLVKELQEKEQGVPLIIGTKGMTSSVPITRETIVLHTPKKTWVNDYSANAGIGAS
ncbi:MAG: hypothetical protein ACK5T0_08930 [Vampirovibrionales bacterium]